MENKDYIEYELRGLYMSLFGDRENELRNSLENRRDELEEDADLLVDELCNYCENDESTSLSMEVFETLKAEVGERAEQLISQEVAACDAFKQARQEVLRNRRITEPVIADLMERDNRLSVAMENVGATFEVLAQTLKKL